jgi:hypothetical protein
MPEVTSDLLVYAAVPAGTAQAPKDAPSWQIKCLIEPGGKLDGESGGRRGLRPQRGDEERRQGQDPLQALGQAQGPGADEGASAAPLAITVDNQSDRTLRFIKAENDGGRFDPSPPEQIAPKKKASCRALDTARRAER